MSKSHRDWAVRSVTPNMAEKATKTWAVRFVAAKSWPERELPGRSSTICHGQELGRNSHRDSAVRFVTAKSGPERATEIRQYDLLQPRVGQKELPRFGNTICYDLELARKSHGDSAVRFVAVKSSTICCGQELARKSHRDSAVRFVTSKSGPERGHHNWAVRFLRPRVGQKEAPRPETRQYDSLPPNVVRKKTPTPSQT